MNRNEIMLARQKRVANMTEEQRAALEAVRKKTKRMMSTECCHIEGSLPGDWSWINSGDDTRKK